MTDLKDLKELAEAATGSEWEASGTVVWMPDVEYGMEPDCCGCFNRDGSCCGNAVPRQTEELVQREIANADGRDAAFIAAANPKTVLELIALVEELEGDIEFFKNAQKYSGEIEHDLRAALEQAKAREAELRSALDDEIAGAKILDEAGMENGDKYAVVAALLAKLSAQIIGLQMGTPEGLNVKNFARHCEAELSRIRLAVTAMGGDDNG